MHYHRLAQFNINLNNELTSLNERYSILRNKFDKYVRKTESKLTTIVEENKRLSEELEVANLKITELERKLNMDSNNSSIPFRLNRKFNKIKEY